MLTSGHFLLKIQRLYRASNVDPDKVTHYEPPQLNLCCLQIQRHCIFIYGAFYVSSLYWQNTFVSPSAFSRRAVVSYWRKYVHEVLVNGLGGLSLTRKSVVRLTNRPDMTLDVYHGRKTTIQQQQHHSVI